MDAAMLISVLQDSMGERHRVAHRKHPWTISATFYIESIKRSKIVLMLVREIYSEPSCLNRSGELHRNYIDGVLPI